jgi:hypothetical protein
LTDRVFSSPPVGVYVIATLMLTLPARRSFFSFGPCALTVSLTVAGASTLIALLARADLTPLPETASSPGFGTLTGSFAIPVFFLYFG